MTTTYKQGAGVFLTIAMGLLIAHGSRGQETQPSANQNRPEAPPGAHDSVTLFSGKPEDVAANWAQDKQPGHWKVEEGAMIASGNSLSTKATFTDFQLHLEFKVPNKPNAKGQAKGNSGVFLQGRYEVQVLDSYGIADPGTGDCGAIYTIASPLVNACKPPETWQTYDIAFRAPRFDTSTHAMKEPARATVLLNGIVVQNATEITRKTHQEKATKGPNGEVIPPKPDTEDLSTPGPISLQFHQNAVAYRNIWIRPLKEKGATHY